MALPTNPVLFSTSFDVAAAAGSDRIIIREIRGESGGALSTLDALTYGGQAAFRIETFPLAGNQLFCHYGFFDEAAIAARSDDTFDATWSGSSPSGVTVATYQYNNVDQGTPLGDFQSASNSGGTIISPPNIATLDGGVIVESVGSGNGGGTWTWVNFTQQGSVVGSGYSWTVATRATATAGSYATEYVNGTANRSSLVAFSLNEVGSVGLGITEVNDGDPLSPNLQNVSIDGSSFGATQGTGQVTISATDDVDDVNATAITTVDSWSDTEVVFDVPESILLLHGEIYVFVTNDDGDSNANGFLTTLQPQAGRDYLTIFEQHEDGLLDGVANLKLFQDQIEWQLLTENGGTLHVEISGLFTIRDYPATAPATDIIYYRLGDAADQTWSSIQPEGVGINRFPSGLTILRRRRGEY